MFLEERNELIGAHASCIGMQWTSARRGESLSRMLPVTFAQVDSPCPSRSSGTLSANKNVPSTTTQLTKPLLTPKLTYPGRR